MLTPPVDSCSQPRRGVWDGSGPLHSPSPSKSRQLFNSLTSCHFALAECVRKRVRHEWRRPHRYACLRSPAGGWHCIKFNLPSKCFFFFIIFFKSTHAILCAVWSSVKFSIIFFRPLFCFLHVLIYSFLLCLALAKAIRVDFVDALSSRASSSRKTFTKLLLLAVFNPSKSYVRLSIEWSECVLCGRFRGCIFSLEH